MKKYLHIALMLLFVLTITSCSKDDENKVDEVWKQQNEEAFQKIAANPEYKKLESESKNGYILYKVLKEGDGQRLVLWTDSVRMYYKGCLISNSAGQIVQDLTKVLEEGYAFNSYLFEDGEPVDFELAKPSTGYGLIDGWQTALQNMREGDRWEIWIPQKLGYGASADKIPAYSTLVFDLEVVKILTK